MIYFNEMLESDKKWPSIVDMIKAKGMLEDRDIMTTLSTKQHDPKLGHDKIFGGAKT